MADFPVNELQVAVEGALNEHLKDSLFSSRHTKPKLHYGSDLDPEKCERQIWYALHRPTLAKENTLGERIRFNGGHVQEDLIGQALGKKFKVVEKQIVVAPERPSAKRWASGRADLSVRFNDLNWLLEIKAPRAASINRPLAERYVWQLSAYYWTLKEPLSLDRAAVVLIDREGANGVRAFVLGESQLRTESEIVAQETRKDAIYDLAVPNDQPGSLGCKVPYSRQIRVWKNKDKKHPPKAVKVRSWQCGYCAYVDNCKPGPEEIEVYSQADGLGPDMVAAQNAANLAWIMGSKASPFVYHVGKAVETL